MSSACLCAWASGALYVQRRALESLEFAPLNHLWFLWILKEDLFLIMCMCVYVSYFPVAVIRYHDQNQLKEENLFWLRVQR